MGSTCEIDQAYYSNNMKRKEEPFFCVATVRDARWILNLQIEHFITAVS